MLGEVLSLSMSMQGVYLLPFVFALMVLAISGQLVDVIYSAVGKKRAR